MRRRLCLDGPLNGRYADDFEATAAGYVLDLWHGADELVYVQAPINLNREAARALYSHTSDALAEAAKAFDAELSAGK